MNDPHVEKLFYRVIIPDHTDYDNAPPISGENDEFKWHLSKEQLVLECKPHFASENEARAVADSLLRAWEVSIGLRQSPRDLTFRFQSSSIIDRSPPPESGTQTLKVLGSGGAVVGGHADVRVSYAQLPVPCRNFAISPEVEMMYSRYSSYRKDKKSLLSMAYWCLTIIEGSTRVSKKKRRTAADQYGIDIDVLNELGRLSSEAGDETEARKFTDKSTLASLTQNEKNWVESVVKKLIERMAEYAYDPSAKLQQVTISDSPSTTQGGSDRPAQKPKGKHAMGFTLTVSRYHDPLADSLVPFKGSTMTNDDIRKALLKKHPSLRDKEDWILPSDHCDNHTNAGACRCSMTTQAIFRRIGRGKFLVL
jgi:hypothetical protein